MLWFAMTRLDALEQTNPNDLREEDLPLFNEHKLKKLISRGVSTEIIRKSIPML